PKLRLVKWPKQRHNLPASLKRHNLDIICETEHLAANRLPFAIPPLAHLDLEFLLQHALYPQAVRKVLEQHRPGMARQLFGAKADVEFAHFSAYLRPVPLLGASGRVKWSVRNHHFCRVRRHLAKSNHRRLAQKSTHCYIKSCETT